MTLVHATIEPGARLDLPWDVDFNALVYVLNGSGTVGTDGRPIQTGQSAVFGAGDYLTDHRRRAARRAARRSST